MTGRIYAYCRVSKNDGSMTIENQTHAIEEWAKTNNVTISATFQDECKGDTPLEKRTGLPSLLKNLKKGDTVVVFEIFRLYRGFSGLPAIYKTIVEDKKAELITLNEKERVLCTNYGDNNDIMQQAIKSMVMVFMSLFSELERKNISRRTSNALQERKSKGVKLGRPIVEAPKNFKELFEQAAQNKRTHASVMKELNLKKATYYKLAEKLELQTTKRITPYMKKKGN